MQFKQEADSFKISANMKNIKTMSQISTADKSQTDNFGWNQAKNAINVMKIRKSTNQIMQESTGGQMWDMMPVDNFTNTKTHEVRAEPT